MQVILDEPNKQQHLPVEKAPPEEPPEVEMNLKSRVHRCMAFSILLNVLTVGCIFVFLVFLSVHQNFCIGPIDIEFEQTVTDADGTDQWRFKFSRCHVQIIPPEATSSTRTILPTNISQNSTTQTIPTTIEDKKTTAQLLAETTTTKHEFSAYETTTTKQESSTSESMVMDVDSDPEEGDMYPIVEDDDRPVQDLIYFLVWLIQHNPSHHEGQQHHEVGHHGGR